MDYDASCGTRTGIRNRHSQQFVDYVANDLDRVVAGLVADRITAQYAAARQRGSLANTRMVVLKRQHIFIQELAESVS